MCEWLALGENDALERRPGAASAQATERGSVVRTRNNHARGRGATDGASARAPAMAAPWWRSLLPRLRRAPLGLLVLALLLLALALVLLLLLLALALLLLLFVLEVRTVVVAALVEERVG